MSNAMAKVSRLSGIEQSIRQKKLLEYQKLEKFLEQMLREAQTDLSNHNVARVGEMVSRGVLFICDVTVFILGEKTGPAGTVVSKAYDGGKLLVDAAYSNVDAKTGWTMLAKNKALVTQKSLEYAGKGGAAKTVGRSAEIIDQGMQLYSWWQSSGKDGFDGAAGISAAISTLNRQLSRIRMLIKELEAEST